MAQMLAQRLGIAHLSTGELFRQEIRRGTALGRAVTRYVNQGRLVPDRVVVRIMTSRLSRRRLDRGLVLDGFPRTVGQARGLDRFLTSVKRPLSGAVYLACSQPTLIRRLGGRRVCSRCGAIYHMRNMPPKRPNRCDRCNGPLTIRKDDQAKTIRKRLAIDRVEAKPLLAYYRRAGLLYRLDGGGHSEQTFPRLVRLLRQQAWIV